MLELDDVRVERAARHGVNLLRYVAIDMRQQLVQDIERDVPERTLWQIMARRLDVEDFGTPIRTIETTSVGGHARMRVELVGAGEIAVYQVNRQIILSPH